jgi:hypothetical protein
MLLYRRRRLDSLNPCSISFSDQIPTEGRADKCRGAFCDGCDRPGLVGISRRDRGGPIALALYVRPCWEAEHGDTPFAGCVGYRLGSRGQLLPTKPRSLVPGDNLAQKAFREIRPVFKCRAARDDRARLPRATRTRASGKLAGWPPRPRRLYSAGPGVSTMPTTAWPPECTWTCSTVTFCWPLPRWRLSASRRVAYVRD